MEKILLIDDEKDVLLSNQKFLTEKGMHVHIAQNALEAIKLLRKNKYDCIILDVLLEETSGFELCKTIKRITDSPVIFFSNLAEEEYQMKGFLSGGDDYIAKKWSHELFWLRLKARLNNYQKASSTKLLEYPPLSIDLIKRVVILKGEKLIMTASEFDILVLLAENPGKVFSLSDIFKEIWHQNDLKQPQTVQVHVSRMRHKLEAVAPNCHFIETVWGKGYKFNPGREKMR